MKTELLITLIALFCGTTFADKLKGFDMSDPCNSFDCFKNNGFSFTIPRAYKSAEGNWWPVI